MNYRLMPAIGVLFTATVSFTAPASSVADGLNPLTVHEWGTFTSIAGADGNAVDWLPLGGPSDLPCFVERSFFNTKGSLSGTVRMETPVIYFYATRETTVTVNVRFPKGAITEWFPPAVTAQGTSPIPFGSDSALTWRNVRVSPGLAENFLVEPADSHYYAARHTGAAPLQSGLAREKFLFYRGVGRFPLPIAATVDANGHVTVTHPRGRTIGDVILFDNHRGQVSYSVRHAVDGQALEDVPVADQTPTLELERMLLANGLYAEEASAMIETWRDSWFEEGTRLFYVVPRPAIDAVLPLTVDPAPIGVARVFVGRMELVTPTTMAEVRDALVADRPAALAPYGRFLQAIGRRIAADSTPADRMVLEQRLQNAASAWLSPQSRCGT